MGLKIRVKKKKKIRFKKRKEPEVLSLDDKSRARYAAYVEGGGGLNYLDWLGDNIARLERAMHEKYG